MLRLRSRLGTTNRCCDCDHDRGWQIGVATAIAIGDDESVLRRREGEIMIRDDEFGLRMIGFRVRRERSVLGGLVLGCNDLASGAIGAMNELDLGFSGFIGVGFWVRWGSVSSLSLSVQAHLPLTQLSLCFLENGYLKVK